MNEKFYLASYRPGPSGAIDRIRIERRGDGTGTVQRRTSSGEWVDVGFEGVLFENYVDLFFDHVKYSIKKVS